MPFYTMQTPDGKKIAGTIELDAKTLPEALTFIALNPKLIPVGFTVVGPLDRSVELIDQLAKNYAAIETANITPLGAVDLKKWYEAGNPKAVAVGDWFRDHWAEYRQRYIDASNGKDVSLIPSRVWKPFTFDEMLTEAGENP